MSSSLHFVDRLPSVAMLATIGCDGLRHSDPSPLGHDLERIELTVKRVNIASLLNTHESGCQHQSEEAVDLQPTSGPRQTHSNPSPDLVLSAQLSSTVRDIASPLVSIPATDTTADGWQLDARGYAEILERNNRYDVSAMHRATAKSAEYRTSHAKNHGHVRRQSPYMVNPPREHRHRDKHLTSDGAARRRSNDTSVSSIWVDEAQQTEFR